MSDIRLEVVGIHSPNKPNNNIHHHGPNSESGIEDSLYTTNEAIDEPLNDVAVFDNKVLTPDVNIYQQKKTLAQGMMDLALILANARQLKDVLESSGKMPYYLLCLVLIGISLSLQIGVGVMLIWNSRYNVKKHHDMCRANRVNNFTVCSIFVITITNVFISVFAGFDNLKD